MREVIIRLKLYKFIELSEKSKDVARDWYRQGSDDSSWAFDQIKNDAEHVGLKIQSLDTHRHNEGEFITTPLACCEAILKEHGNTCETYRTAERYIEAIRLASFHDTEDCITEIDENNVHEFLYALLEDYRVNLEKEQEYQNSNDFVDENIIANDYEFSEDGKNK